MTQFVYVFNDEDGGGLEEFAFTDFDLVKEIRQRHGWESTRLRIVDQLPPAIEVLKLSTFAYDWIDLLENESKEVRTPGIIGYDPGPCRFKGIEVTLLASNHECGHLEVEGTDFTMVRRTHQEQRARMKARFPNLKWEN